MLVPSGGKILFIYIFLVSLHGLPLITGFFIGNYWYTRLLFPFPFEFIEA